MFSFGVELMDSLKVQTNPEMKRLACQIYTQLPEDKREALQVLNYVRQIIFCLGEEWEVFQRSAPILPFDVARKGREGYPKALQEGRSDHQDTANRE